MVTVTITDDKHVHSSEVAHVPNMVRNMLNCREGQWTGDTGERAAKLWGLALFLPHVPAYILMEIAGGNLSRLKYDDEAETVTVDVSYTNGGEA